MSDAELRDGEAFSMRVLAGDARVCVAFPAEARDPAACAGLGLEKRAPSFDGVTMAFIRKPGDWFTVAVKKLPADRQAQPTSDDAAVFASRLVAAFARGIPAPLKVTLASVKSSVVKTQGDAQAYDIQFDVGGTTDATARVAHQHHVIVPVQGAEYAIAWASSAASASDLDDMAERSAATIRVQHPVNDGGHGPALAAGIAGATVLLLGAAVWLRFVRRRVKA